MRLIHTADWQIGKSFRKYGEKEGLFRAARLKAIESIGRLARDEGVRHVLVAGDVYDSENLSPKTLREPLERMREFSEIAWWLLPGNHDPNRPKGVWERVRAEGPPTNVHLLLKPEPREIEPGVFLLPAPLQLKHETRDLTACMDEAQTPGAKIRIGLAHGSVTGFGTEGEAQNPIDPKRPDSAQLDYLALGDWHRTMEVSPRVWYAGTPEPDRHGGQETGQALLVEIDSGSAPRVAPKAVGQYRWVTVEERIDGEEALAALEKQLDDAEQRSSTVLRLHLNGALPLALRAELESRLSKFESAYFHVELDLGEVDVRPTEEDLERIDFDGALRRAAEELRSRIADSTLRPAERAVAKEALIELYLRAGGGSQARGASA